MLPYIYSPQRNNCQRDKSVVAKEYTKKDEGQEHWHSNLVRCIVQNDAGDHNHRYKAEKKVHKLHFVQSCIKTVVNVKEQMIIRIISEFGVTPHKGAELRHDIFAIHCPFSA